MKSALDFEIEGIKELKNLSEIGAEIKSKVIPETMAFSVAQEIKDIQENLSKSLNDPKRFRFITKNDSGLTLATSSVGIPLPTNSSYKKIVKPKRLKRKILQQGTLENIKFSSTQNTYSADIIIDTFVEVSKLPSASKMISYRKGSGSGSFSYGAVIDGNFINGIFPILIPNSKGGSKVKWLARLRSSSLDDSKAHYFHYDDNLFDFSKGNSKGYDDVVFKDYKYIKRGGRAKLYKPVVYSFYNTFGKALDKSVNGGRNIDKAENFFLNSIKKLFK